MENGVETLSPFISYVYFCIAFIMAKINLIQKKRKFRKRAEPTSWSIFSLWTWVSQNGRENSRSRAGRIGSGHPSSLRLWEWKCLVEVVLSLIWSLGGWGEWRGQTTIALKLPLFHLFLPWPPGLVITGGRGSKMEGAEVSCCFEWPRLRTSWRDQAKASEIPS